MEIIIVLALAVTLGSDQPSKASQLALAKSLCDIDAVRREKVINRVVASPKRNLPLLLEWARNPPPELGICKDVFDMSLAEIFGRLRTTDAIPFLIDHISLIGGGISGIWNKSIESAGRNVPAVHALTEIGPPATPELLSALDRRPYCPTCAEYEDRFAIIVTLALIKDTRSRPALQRELQRPTREHVIARRALNEMDVAEHRR